MAAPTLQAQGAANAVTTGNLTITLPAYAANDIVVITTVGFVPNTTTGTATQSLSSPWTKNSPNITVITSNLIDEEHACWWARATSTTSLGTTVTITRPTGWDTGTDTCWGGRAYVIRGCPTTGDPFDQFDETALSTAANPALPAITVSGGNRLAIVFMTKADNTATPTAATGYTVGTEATDTAGTDCAFQTYRQTASANVSAVTPTGGTAPAANNGNSCYFYFSFTPNPVTATAAAPLGSVTGTATATVRHLATLSAPLGSVTGSASATVRHFATLAAPLGAVAASASAVVSKIVTAVLAAPLGGLSSSASATVKHVASGDAPLGALSASALATVTPTVTATASASLGGVSASSSALVTHFATLLAPLGSVSASASATIKVFATLTAPLGAMVSSASATVNHFVSLAAPLGAAVSSASATVKHDAVGSASLGAVTASATAKVVLGALASAPLGGVSAVASAVVTPVNPVTPSVGGRPNPYLVPRPKKKKAKVEVVVEEVEDRIPNRVSAVGRVSLGGLRGAAEAGITFSAEEDDLQVLLML